MNEHVEIIDLIDLGKTILQNKACNENRSFVTLDSTRPPSNENSIVNLEQSEKFGCSTSEMNIDEQKFQNQHDNQEDIEIEYDNQNNGLKNLLNIDLNDQQNSDPNNELNSKIRRSFIKNRLKKLSINNPVSNSRNNYEKLTDSLLVKPDQSKYYGSFSKVKQTETSFNGLLPSSANLEDDRSISTSVTSQNLLSVYLKEFEQEKHLNLLGFKTVLIVILSFCFLISLIFTFKVYFDLTDEKLKNFNEKLASASDRHSFTYWRITWISNSIITLIILIIGIIGLLKEKVILILITSVCMMLSLMESDDTINGIKIFNISLFIILFTSVLLIIFAARLRCYAEDKLNLINKFQFSQHDSI